MQESSTKAGNRALVANIIRKMQESPEGALRFRDYMEMCLYDPVGGYYMQERTKIGREGDFYTSSHIGTVMGDVLARYIARLASGTAGTFTVTEWGAGTGRLASQILDRLSSDEPAVYNRLHYRIMEKSPFHRSLQQSALQPHVQVVSYDDGTGEGGESVPSGLMFSNELLDAFPVHRIRRRGDGLMELYVKWGGEATGFEELELPLTDNDMEDYVVRSGIQLEEGQTAEINLDAFRWVREQTKRLAEGSVLLTIDYGDLAEELFARHRMAGTLMCYKEHKAHDNPYIYAGEQDITSHVDFSACIRAGELSGLSSAYMTQKQFLLENGILELLQQHSGTDPFSPEAKRNRSIRQLLLTDGMSELFKVLIQKK